MKKTRMVKLLAVAMCATLVLQPVSVFAEDDYNEPVVEALDNAEAKVEAALPSEEPAAEPVIVEDDPVVETPAIIAQEPTDTHLEKTEAALEKIEDTVTDYNETLKNSEAPIAAADQNYQQKVETAQGSETAFEQAASEAAAASFPAVVETAVDAYSAYKDANKVEQMSAEVYKYQADAEAAKEVAAGIAEQAQAAADDALQVANELGEKVDAAEQAKDQADADYREAELAYDAAVQARKAAENEYNKIINKYGLNNWNFNPDAPNDNWINYGAYGKSDVRTAIKEAKAALNSAKEAEEAAKDDYTNKKGEFDTADEIYQQALLDKEDAEGKLDDAEKALAEAERELKKANLIVAINETEIDEINTFNASQGWWYWGQPTAADVNKKDIDLAKGLIKYQLFDEVEDVDAIGFTVDQNGVIHVNYSKVVEGETVEISRRFTFDVKNEQNIHNLKDSAHWLVVNEIVSQEKHRPVVVGHVTYYTDKRNNGNEVEFNPADYEGKPNYEVHKNNGKITVYEKTKYGLKKILTVYENTRELTEDETYFEDEDSEFYREADYYRANKDFTADAANKKYEEADKNKKDLDDAIARPGTLEEDWRNKANAAGDAEKAKEAAANKLAAVEEAHKAVIAAAKALKDLEKVEKVSYIALTELNKNYYKAVAQLEAAEFAYFWAAVNAGIAQDQADRALAALDKGFEYEIPTPSPNPNPNPSGGEESSGEPATDEPAYIPTAPIAAAPVAPAPEAAVLGATRARGGAAVEAGEGEEVIEEEAPVAVAKKQEEKKEDKKPAVAIEDEETAKAAAPIEVQKGFPWWVLIILAAIAAISIEEYVRRKKANENAQG